MSGTPALVSASVPASVPVSVMGSVPVRTPAPAPAPAAAPAGLPGASQSGESCSVDVYRAGGAGLEVKLGVRFSGEPNRCRCV